MAYDVFAHGVYGIQVTPEDSPALQEVIARMDALIEEAMDRDGEEPTYIDALEQSSDPELRRLIANLVKSVGAPAEAQLFYTGEDHPGRTEAGEDTWIVGFGMLSFPQAYIAIAAHNKTKKLWSQAEWHTWVTGS